MNRFDRNSFDRSSFMSRRTNPAGSYQMTPLNTEFNLTSDHDMLTGFPNDRETSHNMDTNKSSKSKESELQDLTRKIYKWKLTKSITLDIPFNHYSLLAMLDRNSSFFELLLSIFISTMVSVFASLILSEQIYDDILLIIFCAIVASCHYSLLKSVQPDSSSPIHGFNSLTALSRPIYFCLVASIILGLRFTVTSHNSDLLASYLDNITLYGFRLNFGHFKNLLELFEIILLFFPVVFTLGLLPQISTYFLCIIEQCDMYMFGGTAMNNLPGAFLSLLRSLSAILSLSAVLFSSIHSVPSATNNKEKKLAAFSLAKLAADSGQFSQSVIFSVFCALLVLLSYFMSRQTSELLIIIEAIKELFVEAFNGQKLATDLNDSHESLTKSEIKVKRINMLLHGDKPCEKKSSSFINLESDAQVQSKSDNLSVPHASPAASKSIGTGSCQSDSLASVSFCSVNVDADESTPKQQKREERNANSDEPNRESELLESKLPNETISQQEIDLSGDILEKKNKKIIRQRLESDCLTSVLIFLVTFAIHVSTIFTALNPILNDFLFCLAIIVGAVNHYILPQLRTERPWYLFSQPILKPDHWSAFEPSSLAKLVWFEYAYVGLTFIEKNCLNVLVILSAVTMSSDKILLKFSAIDSSGFLACVLISMCSVKLIRYSFCEPAKQYQIFFVAYLFHKFDSNGHSLFPDSETILFDLFFISAFLAKLHDFLDKLTFIYIYTAPWQLPWGSAFHAFAQPLSVPHSALLILQVK